MGVLFLERINNILIKDFIVYIYGQEVSNYIDFTGGISWALSPDGPNTLNITLLNAWDRFLITRDNVNGKWGNTESIKKSIYQHKLARNNQFASVIQRKGYVKKISKDDNSLYNLQPNRLIFHKNDPIRVFIRNPYASENSDEWLPIFTGYIITSSWNENYVTADQKVVISCEDIRNLMQKMRVQVNYCVGFSEPDIIYRDDNSIFSDMRSPTSSGHPFSGRTYEDTVKTLILGGNWPVYKNIKVTENKKNEDGTEGQAIERIVKRKVGYTRKNGVGSFTEGLTQTYPSNTTSFSYIDKEMLNNWYRLCLFGQKRDWWTEAECREYGKGCFPGGKYPPEGSPENKRMLHMLLPQTGMGADTLTNSTFDFGSGTSINYLNRLQIIQDFSSFLHYQVWVTGVGDIVCEFPMYDFQPEDFTPEIANILKCDHTLISSEYADEADNIPVLLEVKGGTAQTEFAINIPGAYSIIIFSRVLAARYGVESENSYQLPFVAKNERLRMLGLLEFQRRLFAASTMSCNLTFRPLLLPNKPFFNNKRDKMGVIQSVNNTIGSPPTTSIQCYCVRSRLGEDQNGRGIYSLITGSDKMPVSFRYKYKEQRDSSGCLEVSNVNIIETKSKKAKK